MLKTDDNELVFISYYTPDGKYPELAEKLRDSLDRFNLSHDIMSVRSFSSWQEGVAFKPNFILDRLLHHRKPVVWLDIDTEVWKFPTLLFGDHDFAIYNWFADEDHHLRGQIQFDSNSEQLLCAGGVQKYGYTMPAAELLVRWIGETSSLQHKKNNDPVLDLAFNKYRPRVNWLWLPKEYNRMDKHTVHWSEIPENEVVINHDYVGGAHRQKS